MQINEKDPQLGNSVNEKLLRLNVEHPIISKFNLQEIKDGISKIISGLGLSLDCESIKESPERITKFYVNELFSGLDYNNFPKITFNHNNYNYSEPVISRNISFKSTCEHHFVTINGKAFVAYIPKDKVIGLSKISRIVEFFSKRPQVQERATLQIFHTLSFILDTEDVALIIKAEHHCITMRGVTDRDVDNITYKFGGQFLNEALKQQFYSSCIG